MDNQEPVAWTTDNQLDWLENENNNTSIMWNNNNRVKMGIKQECKIVPLYTHPVPSQWICVKDRLPEFVDISTYEKSSNDVLILIDGKHFYIGSYIWVSYSEETEFCMRDLDGGYEGVGEMEVTHWMPLPDAPKE